jgi:asparagine synthase (glutamine-hydrolysing)
MKPPDHHATMNPAVSDLPNSLSEARHSTGDSLASHGVDLEFAVGQPRFNDAAQQAVAAQHGALAAWRQRVAQRGDRAAEGVEGSYAVAVRGPTGAWLLAVDRFATHSICYALRDGTLHHARRADDLARHLQGGVADLASSIDPQALFDYLFHHVIPSPRTVFKGVLRLPPAHSLWCHAGQAQLHRHWQPLFAPASAAPFEPLRDRFRSLLRESVSERIPAGAQPVCFLSGGTDSSTIAGMAREVSGRPPASYSIGFDAAGYDEMAYARIAAKAFGCEHHEYYISADDLVRGIPNVAAHFDQPFGNSSAVPAFYCARLAKLDGATHILAGDGGDELFGGNTRYAKERVFGLWEQVPALLRGPLLQPLLDNPLTHAIPGVRKAASYVKQARVPMPDRMQTYNLLTRLGLQAVLTPAFLQQVSVDGPRLDQRGVWAESGGAGLVDRMLAFDWRYTLAENDLPKVVGSTELAGVPVGFPLLDDRLVDFSMGLPASYKLRGLKLRWFFKEALSGFLPDEILSKKKHGFGLPFGPWSLQHQALNALARDSLLGIAERGIVRRDFAHSLLTERLPEHPGYYGEMVWILMMLEQWLRQHAPSYRV